MNRKDYYFRELVTEAELDAGFDASETADRDFALDNDFKQKADGSNVPFSTPDTGDFNALLGGITKGLNVSISGVGATVSAGTAYDCHGRRICLTSPLTVDLSTTGNTSIGFGGAAGGVGSISTLPAATEFRWILLQIFFNRLLTDPREDGNLATVYFDSAESFQFTVKCSASSATPTIPGGDANCIILGAFKRNSAGAIVAENYSTRGDWIRTFSTYDTSPLPQVQIENGTTTDPNFIQGTPRSAIIKLRNAINLSTSNYAGHISQSVPQDKHAAKNIDFNATTANWADGTTPGLATNLGGGIDANGLQGTINTIVSLLSNVTTGQGGTKKIGGASITGSPVTIAAGTLRTQLDALLTGLNSHLNGTAYQHPATDITATNSSVRSSLTVQGQLQDLENRKTPDIFGSGIDGDVIISSVVVLNSDKNYHNLIINNTAALFANNFIIRVSGTLTLIGTGYISADDGGARSGVANSTTPGAGSIHNTSGSVLGGNSGGVGGSFANGPSPPGVNSYLSLGGPGGTGGTLTGTGGPGGTVSSNASTGVLTLANRIQELYTSFLTPGFLYGISGTGSGIKTLEWFGVTGGAGGGGGSWGGGTNGVGGGAGGGILCVLARNAVIPSNKALTAPGYSGGSASSTPPASAGGGGGGGAVLFWYFDKSGVALSAAAACPGGLGGLDTTGFKTAQDGTPGNVFEFQVGY